MENVYHSRNHIAVKIIIAGEDDSSLGGAVKYTENLLNLHLQVIRMFFE